MSEITDLTEETTPTVDDLVHMQDSATGNSRKVKLKNLMAGRLPVYTDGTRPSPGDAGLMIFNSDDGAPNWDDGTTWVDATGTPT